LILFYRRLSRFFSKLADNTVGLAFSNMSLRCGVARVKMSNRIFAEHEPYSVTIELSHASANAECGYSISPLDGCGGGIL